MKDPNPIHHHLVKESSLMVITKKLGLHWLSWSFRRLHCPVNKENLVLEVGSGGNPYFRSNVLLDAYEKTRERHWEPLISDRPTVLGFVEHLPFKDKSFDFVIASHVLEHSKDPSQFLSELQRVAKAGYIEVPDAFMERLNPYRDHRLEITVRHGRLIIRKKPNWKADPELVELYEHRVKKVMTSKTMRKNPFDFHVRYYWSEKIEFEIVNPDIDVNWESPSIVPPPSKKTQKGLRYHIGKFVLATWKHFFSQHKRNKKFQLKDVLACPTCGSDQIDISKEQIQCQNCQSTYPIRANIPVMYSK